MKSEQIGTALVARLGPRYDAFHDEVLTVAEDALKRLADSAPAAGADRLVLDFAATEYFSSSFVELLLRVQNRCRTDKVELVLAALRPDCREILRHMRLDRVFAIADELKDAFGPQGAAGGAST